MVAHLRTSNVERLYHGSERVGGNGFGNGMVFKLVKAFIGPA
jgi:hypothetical protein